MNTYYDDIKKCLSVGKFNAYRLTAPDADDELLARHLWNVQLCETLYPSLQAIELALRNAIDHSIVAATGKSDWFVQGSQSKFVLLLDEQAIIADMMSKLRKKAARRKKALTHGHVVAELTFGFWTTLLSGRYEAKMRPFLAPVFPHIPRRKRRQKDIGRQFQDIRDLRNRVFHHEPVWKKPNLLTLHGEILDALEWISPAMRQTVSVEDRFPAAYRLGWAHYVSVVQAFRQANGF